MENNQEKQVYIINGQKMLLTKQEYIKIIAEQVLKENIVAFKELAKW